MPVFLFSWTGIFCSILNNILYINILTWSNQLLNHKAINMNNSNVAQRVQDILCVLKGYNVKFILQGMVGNFQPDAYYIKLSRENNPVAIHQQIEEENKGLSIQEMDITHRNALAENLAIVVYPKALL